MPTKVTSRVLDKNAVFLAGKNSKFCVPALKFFGATSNTKKAILLLEQNK
jgi:hypothetical protein